MTCAHTLICALNVINNADGFGEWKSRFDFLSPAVEELEVRHIYPIEIINRLTIMLCQELSLAHLNI